MAKQAMRTVKLGTARAGHSFAHEPNGDLSRGADGQPIVTGTFVQAVGDEVNMPADEAQRYIERGYASAVQNKGTT